MKLSLNRHDRCAKAKIDWLDRRTIDRLGLLAAALERPEAVVEVFMVGHRKAAYR